ncbi:hypothetical protein OAS86_06705, partial [Gammaproteobacteria bacterium]|nr:hypothetical protein [Gammaproteobacteria bacterium]
MMVDLDKGPFPLVKLALLGLAVLGMTACTGSTGSAPPQPAHADFGDQRIEGAYDGERLANLIGAELAILRGNRHQASASLYQLIDSEDPLVLRYLAIQA